MKGTRKIGRKSSKRFLAPVQFVLHFFQLYVSIQNVVLHGSLCTNGDYINLRRSSVLMAFSLALHPRKQCNACMVKTTCAHSDKR